MIVAIQIFVAVIALLLIPTCMTLCKRLAFSAMEDERSGPTGTDEETKRLEIVEKLVVKVSFNKVTHPAAVVDFCTSS